VAPKKKLKGGELSFEEELADRSISCERVFVENIIARFKAFKIVVNKYCNRCKHFKLCTSLSYGILNYKNRK